MVKNKKNKELKSKNNSDNINLEDYELLDIVKIDLGLQAYYIKLKLNINNKTKYFLTISASNSYKKIQNDFNNSKNAKFIKEDSKYKLYFSNSKNTYEAKPFNNEISKNPLVETHINNTVKTGRITKYEQLKNNKYKLIVLLVDNPEFKYEFIVTNEQFNCIKNKIDSGTIVGYNVKLTLSEIIKEHSDIHIECSECYMIIDNHSFVISYFNNIFKEFIINTLILAVILLIFIALVYINFIFIAVYGFIIYIIFILLFLFLISVT